MIANTKARRASAPIKWHGGKTYLASRIVSLMPEHIHYVEPFFGGGAVLFRKPHEMVVGHSEVINDVYGELVTFWRVLQSKEFFPEFVRLVSMTPMGKPFWEWSVEDSSPTDPVRVAYNFFVRYRQSRQGLGRDFATMSRNRTRRGMNEQASSWLSAVDGLEDAHARLRRVVIFNEPAVKVIQREDGPKTFFYCDPPYVARTRAVRNAYSHEMSDQDHQELLNTLGQISGRFLLSGYRNPLYDSAARKFGWNRTDITIDNKASSKKEKPQKVECIWANF